MYTVEYLPGANKDILDISEYIGINLRNPAAADRLIDKIISAVDKLADMPYMYAAYESPLPVENEYRKMYVKNYTIFYFVDETKKSVKIARVIYSKRNFSDILE